MSSSTSGHRQRIQDRFAKAGLESFHDYEIVELLLTLVIPRKDTKDLAKTLLKKYGSITGILSANQRELESVEGLGKRSVTLLKFIRDLNSHCLQESYHRKDQVTSKNDVAEYLQFHFSKQSQEYATVLFLDNGNRIMKTEIIAEGTVNHCTVYPRNIFDSAFKVGAASIILAHNHPGGSSSASDADWNLTKRLFDAGKLLDIELLDHIIINDRELISLRSLSRWPK